MLIDMHVKQNRSWAVTYHPKLCCELGGWENVSVEQVVDSLSEQGMVAILGREFDAFTTCISMFIANPSGGHRPFLDPGVWSLG